MERSSSEKFWKGNGNDVLSATEGNTGEPGDGAGSVIGGREDGS